MKKFLWIFFVSTFCFSQSSKDKAKTYLVDKDYKKAQQELTTFLESNPSDIEAIELLGDAYGHQKQWDEAIEQYEKLKDNYPKNANYHYKYGGALGPRRPIQVIKYGNTVRDAKIPR